MRTCLLLLLLSCGDDEPGLADTRCGDACVAAADEAQRLCPGGSKDADRIYDVCLAVCDGEPQ